MRTTGRGSSTSLRFLAATGCGAGATLSAHALPCTASSSTSPLTNAAARPPDYYGDMEHHFAAKALLFHLEHPAPASCASTRVVARRRRPYRSDNSVSALTSEADWQSSGHRQTSPSARRSSRSVDPPAPATALQCPILGCSQRPEHCGRHRVHMVTSIDLADVIIVRRSLPRSLGWRRST